MAYDKAVDSGVLNAGLTSIADAIRTKGGTSGAMAFPAGFVAAIEAIETGGELKYATGTITPAIGTKTMTANGVGFKPSIVFMQHSTAKSLFCFGSANFTAGYNGTKAYTPQFQPSDDGFTFTSTVQFPGNAIAWTWYAYGL